MEKKLIFVVEDEWPIRNCIIRFTKKLCPSCVVEGFSDGHEAFEAFKSSKNQPALIITDFRMPLMNGYELAKAVIQLSPSRHPAFVLITGELSDQLPPDVKSIMDLILDKSCPFGGLEKFLKTI